MLKATAVRKCDTSPINTFDQANFTAGGLFQIASGRYYPENAPRQFYCAASFGLSASLVANREFARIVETTGHVTETETSIHGRSDGGQHRVSPATITNGFWTG